MTKNPDVRFAKSIVDYIFRWMASKFLSPEAQYRAGVNNRDEAMELAESATVPAPKVPSTPTARLSPTGAIVPSDLAVRGDPEPGRRAAVHHLRLDHGAQRGVLQVQQLRNDFRLRVVC